ncbi:MAG TPA: MBL fold metallo-hydrolase [Woeseiaceae bacterium]|nr:MBL fold metallo-hydrolase [Woeseiaceae bacterium]
MSEALRPGRVTALASGVRRLVAPNPGLMTGPGTNTYILGEREFAVIDPGPDSDAHVAAIRAATGDRVHSILVTHTHVDHSPAARRLALLTGAPVLGRPAPAGPHQDASFSADRVLDDGDSIAVEARELRALRTPGHASNHVCYRLDGADLLFTGDHIINGSTVVIDPPDGNMADYLASLARLKNERLAAIAPGHGALIEAPFAAIDWLIAHRLEREARVLEAVRAAPGASMSVLVPAAYAGTRPQLHALAARSLLAHLEKLAADGRVIRKGGGWFATGG